MKKIFITILLVCTVSYVVYGDSPTTWYANNGSQNGTGTKSDPFGYNFSLQGGGGKINGGDIVKFLPGAYDPVRVTAKYLSLVTYKPEEKPGSVIFYSTESQINQGGVISVDGGENIRFESLHIIGNNPNRNKLLSDLTGVGSGFNLIIGKNIDIVNCYIRDVTGSGIYNSSPCVNTRIEYNIIKYVGYRSTKRRHHHGLYLQSDKDHSILVRGNVIIHPAGYGTQVWQQANPRKQASKINNVTFIDNIYLQSEETALHYGGYNDTRNAVMINNSIYNSVSNYGIRVGYTTNGPDNDVFGTRLSGNYIQGNVRLINPRSDMESVDNNTIVIAGQPVTIGTFYEDQFKGILQKWENNKFYSKTSKPIKWYDDDYDDEIQKIVRNFNIDMTVDQLHNHSLPKSNKFFEMSDVENFIRIIPNPIDGKLHIAVHNPEMKDEIKMDLTKYFSHGDDIEIYDAENLLEPIYKSKDKVVEIDMNSLSVMEPVFGNLDIDPKTGKDFACLIVYGPQATTQGRDEPISDNGDDGNDNDNGLLYEANFDFIVKSQNEFRWLEILTQPEAVGSVQIRPEGSSIWLTENNPPYTFPVSDGKISGTEVDAKQTVILDVILFEDAKGQGKATALRKISVDFSSDNSHDQDGDELKNIDLDKLVNYVDSLYLKLLQLSESRHFETIKLLDEVKGMIKNQKVEIEIKE